MMILQQVFMLHSPDLNSHRQQLNTTGTTDDGLVFVTGCTRQPGLHASATDPQLQLILNCDCCLHSVSPVHHVLPGSRVYSP